jgi:hypothetical protein
MWMLLALFFCCFFPVMFCLGAAWLWGTPEAVMAGTLVGGFAAVVTAINLVV